MIKNKVISFLPIWGKQNETIPIQQMKALRELGAKAQYGLPGSIFPLSKTYLKQKPDIISLDWIHQYCLSPGIFQSLVKSFFFMLDVLLVTKIFRVRLVWTLHNLRHHDPRPRKIEKMISSFFAGNCIKVRIFGEGMENEICQYLNIDATKLVVIPEGSYIGWYPEGQDQEGGRKILQIPEQKKVWLYLGNLRPYKGVEELILAFQEIQPPDTELHIAGNPWNTKYSESLVQLSQGNENIKLHFKTIPDDELQNYFSASDLVVLPFKNVLNSGSALLAMGFEKAIVAPSIGLLPYRLKSQKQLLYQPSEGVEAGLRRILSLSKEELKSIGQANKKEALKHNWSDFARFLIHV